MCTALIPVWDIIPLSESIRNEADEHAESFLSFDAFNEMGGSPNAARFARMALNESVRLNKIASWLDDRGKNG